MKGCEQLFCSIIETKKVVYHRIRALHKNDRLVALIYVCIMFHVKCLTMDAFIHAYLRITYVIFGVQIIDANSISV